MNEHKRLLKNTGIIAIGNLSTKLVSFFLLPLYTSILTTAEYGITDYIFSISSFCVPFVSVLMDESMFRFLIDCKTDDEKKKIISNSMIIITLGAILFLLLALPILSFINYEYTVYLVMYVLTSVLSSMLSALLRGIGRTDKYAIYNFLVSLTQICLNIFLIVILKWGIKGMLSASIISHIVIPFFYMLRMKLWKYIDLHSFDKSKAKEMIVYSIPLIPNKISWSIINLSDRIIIMNIIGSGASGLYAISYKFPNLMDTVYGFFYQSWKESSARSLKDNGQEVFYNEVYRYLKSFMYSIVLGMTAFMPLVFKLLINKTYHEAILYVPILLLATYFANISGFYGGVFTAHKDTKIMGTTTIAAAFINLVINVLFIRKLGIYAAAISTLLANYGVYEYRRRKVKKYITLYENITRKISSWITTITVAILFYTMDTKMQILGGIIAVIYAVIENKEILRHIYMRIKKNNYKN